MFTINMIFFIGDNQSLKIQVARPGIEPRSLAPEVYTMSKLAEYFFK